jgi:hypothetical protein
MDLTQKELNDLLAELPVAETSDVKECKEAMDKLDKTARDIKTLTVKSDREKTQHLLAEFLDDVHHLELTSKRLVRLNVKAPSK